MPKLLVLGRTYDRLKKSALIFMPALATLYFAFSEIWGLPYGKEVVGTVAAITTFAGSVVHVSSKNYYGGDHDVTGYIDEDKVPDALATNLTVGDKVVLKVQKSAK